MTPDRPDAAACRVERRREDVRRSVLAGIEFVETGADATTLEVHFLGKAPPDIGTANVRIAGGAPVTVRGVVVHRDPDPAIDDWMEVLLVAPGDASTYTFELTSRGDGAPIYDPLFAAASFRFDADCPSDLDCCAPAACPPSALPSPDIDYLAKDYDSFRRLLLDRLALTMPGWRETHVPDVGLTLVELLAYAGDQLSYFQDAVATEAFLGTARLRTSLRRHARLVDYALHEGCNARAWLTLATSADTMLDLANVAFCTVFAGAPSGRRLLRADLTAAPSGSVEWFEPLWPDRKRPMALRQTHNEIAFYAWGDCACCLPAGTTRATLRDGWVDGADPPQRVLALRAGDVLILEEVVGPRTGEAADADPGHRQAVRLTRVTPAVDPLYQSAAGGIPVLEVEWCSEDALRFPLCLSAVMPAPDCSCRDGISLARGNVLLVDSGMCFDQVLEAVPSAGSTIACASDCAPPRECIAPPPSFRLRLDAGPLTFAQPLADACCAAAMARQDPRRALPQLWLEDATAASWTPAYDLLEGGPDDRSFVTEVDDDGVAYLRFGNDVEGRRPDAGTVFTAHARLGNGVAGNVGAETIRCLVALRPGGDAVAVVPRNPLAASGGAGPESASDVRAFAPGGPRAQLERAITAQDYETLLADNARRLAERSPRLCGVPFEPLQAAKATLRWSGSWYEAVLALDPLGRESVDAPLMREVDAYLAPYRRIGYDVRAEAPDYVPLDLGLLVCVGPQVQRAHVKAALIAIFGTGVLSNGKLAIFNPDNLGFGTGVFASRLVAAAQAVQGVIEVQLTRLARYAPGTPAPTGVVDSVPAGGLLKLSPHQIARLDNDPSQPSNGRLTIILRGGR